MSVKHPLWQCPGCGITANTNEHEFQILCATRDQKSIHWFLRGDKMLAAKGDGQGGSP